jgi:hypothetical protein
MKYYFTYGSLNDTVSNLEYVPLNTLQYVIRRMFNEDFSSDWYIGEKYQQHGKTITNCKFVIIIIRIIEWRRMRWAEHVPRKGNNINSNTKICLENQKKGEHSEDWGLDRM